jgi:hypothetical protein
VSQILIGCIFIFIKFQKLFGFPLLFLLWPTDCWVVCYSASNFLHIFCRCFVEF